MAKKIESGKYGLYENFIFINVKIIICEIFS